MATNKQKLANANKRAREAKSSMMIGAQVGTFSAGITGATVKALTPPIPVVGDAGLDAGMGLVCLLAGLPGRKGGAYRTAMFVAAANFGANALGEVIEMLLPEEG